MFEKIRSYLASELDISEDEITRDTTFESLGVDSLDTVEMVMLLLAGWPSWAALLAAFAA